MANRSEVAETNRPLPATAILDLLGMSPIPVHNRPILRVPGEGA